VVSALAHPLRDTCYCGIGIWEAQEKQAHMVPLRSPSVTPVSGKLQRP
jgi:hypothetical protein